LQATPLHLTPAKRFRELTCLSVTQSIASPLPTSKCFFFCGTGTSSSDTSYRDAQFSQRTGSSTYPTVLLPIQLLNLCSQWEGRKYAVGAYHICCVDVGKKLLGPKRRLASVHLHNYRFREGALSSKTRTTTVPISGKDTPWTVPRPSILCRRAIPLRLPAPPHATVSDRRYLCRD